MKNIYKILFLLIICCCIQQTYAQKRLRMQVTNVNTNKNTDCDGIGDSDFEWRWFNGGSDRGCAYFDGNNGPINNSSVRDLYDGSYWSADCWAQGIGLPSPGGAVTITLRVAENDEFTGTCNSGSYCTRTDGTTVPLANAAVAVTTFANNTGVDCNNGCDAPWGGAANLNYKHTLSWNIEGAYDGNNLDANGYTNNKTCATAKNITSGNRTDDVNQCTDAWYYFDVSATNLSNLTFNGANGTVTVFYDASSSCNTSCEVGSGNGSVSIGGPISVGRYYIRVSANGGRTNISRSTTTGANTNNYIAAADDAGNNGNLGAMPAGGGTLAANDNNNGTNQESGEPGLADSHTDWFFFTTGATVPAYVDINVYGDYGGDDLDADFKLWKQNDTAYVFPRSCVDWSKLTNLGDGDGDDNVNCRIDGTFENTLNSYRRFCLDPNSKYYVQVAGWQNNTAVFCPNANEDEGTYRITVVGSTTAQGKDNVCDAHDFGTLNSNSSTGNVYYNNTCLGTQAGEQRLGDMSNTMWYKFTTPTDGLTGVNINIEEAGEDANYVAATLYLKSTAACSGTSGLTEVAFDRWCFSDGGTFSAECLLGGRDYYLQVGTGYNFDACTNILNGGRSAGRIKVNISSYNATNGVDNICNGTSINAKLLGNINTTSGSFATLNNQSNICASTEAGEPSGGQKTVWYYFTTGATVPRNINIRMAEQDGIDPDLYLYEACGNVCGGPTWSNLTNEKNSWDADATNVFDTDAEINETGYLHPNSTYFIRCDGGGGILETEGIFSLAVNWNGTFNSNDDFCNAWLAGTTNGGAAAHTESITNNDTLDLGETISIPTFNNKSATAQEQCDLDEPNNDDGDETVWFKLVTSNKPGSSIDIDLNASNGSSCVLGGSYGWLRVYEADGLPALPTNCAGWTNSTDWFDGITPTNGSFYGVALTILGTTLGDNSKFRIECPKPNTTYYLQIENAYSSLGACDMSDFTMTIKDNGITPAPDFICMPASSNTAGVDGFLGTLNSNYDLRTSTGLPTVLDASDYDLRAINQTTQCLTYSGAYGEPDNTGISSPNNTAWYRFRTPAADYPSTNSLKHTYTIDVNMNAGTPVTSLPAVYIYKETATTTRTCADGAGDYNNLMLIDKWVIDDIDDVIDAIADGFDILFENLCFDPNTNYYIQVENTGLADYVNFDLIIKKSAFRPGDNLCEATDLGIMTNNGLANGTPTDINWYNTNKFNGAPYFGLPHTNRCATSESGELGLSNSATVGGPDLVPPYDGTFQSTVWYKFTTGNTVPDWILWAKDDDNAGTGERGTTCASILGNLFRSKVLIYQPYIPASCPIIGQMVLQDEMNIPGDPLCDVSTGVGLPGIGEPSAAPCDISKFRLKCPQPNTTYYVQFQDAGFTSSCYEGLWSFDNGTQDHIQTASGLGGAPINDSICNAIDLGSVPNGGQLAPATLYDNFCATPDVQWRADFSQDLDADVWFRFKPPLSGSVLITAQSAPAGSPGVDDDLDIQMAIWEPILGNGTNTHCSDPRYLWTPILAQDHKDCELTEAGIGACSGLSTNVLYAYDIYNTCGGSSAFSGAFCNEGNSFIATCLDPNKYYYLQVDGGDYLTCDVFDAGDCVMGYFKLQIKDAALGLVNPDNTTTNISPYTALGIRNFDYIHDEPCFAYNLGTPQNASLGYSSLSWKKMTNRCATSIGDPLPYQWGARNSSTDKTVWASFVAPSTGKVKIRAENIDQIRGEDDYHQDINLQLAVFQTSNCFDKWRLTELRSGFGFDGGCIEIDSTNADDYIGVCVPGVLGCGFDEYMVVSCLKPGEIYYIMIDGDASYVAGADFEDVEGDFRISVQEVSGIPASTNDDICDAATIAGVNALAVNGSVTTVAFNNSCATIEPNIEGAGKIAEKITGTYQDILADITTDEFNVEHSLWFKFQAPASGKVRIEALQEVNDIDLGIAVYDIPNQTCNGLATNGFTIMEDYDPPILGGQSEDMEVHCLVPNRWYWVQVDGDRNTTCGPLLTAICGDPLRDVAGGTGTDCETGQFKVKITHLPADPTYASNVDYTVNPDLPGGNDNMCEAHRVKNASGSINIFNNATYLQNGESITFRHNNRCATTEVNEPELNGWDLNPFNSDNTPTVWYAFNTGPILPPLLPGEITINVTNPSGTCFDPDMDLYEYTGALNTYYTAAGCTNLGNNKFNRLYRVGEGSNIPYLPNIRNERITLTCPKPMTTYLLRVAGSSACPLFGDNMGDFDISISMSATPGLDVANDDICNASNMGTVAAGGSQVKNLQNNFCATQQQGEPNTDQDCVQSEPCSDETVWFKFRTSATPGDIEVVVRDVLSNGYIAAPQIAVYRYIGADNSCTTDPFNGIAKLDENTGVVVLAGVTVDSAKVSIPCAKPNTWYYVQVDGIDMSLLGFTLPGATDNFLFNLQVRDLGNYSKRASNDNLVNALPMDSTVTAPGLYVLPAGGTKSRYGHNICATCENNESGDYCGTSETGHTAIFSAEDETVWFYFTTSDNPGVTTITVADNPSISGTFSPNFTLYYYNQTMGNPAFRVTNAPSRVIIQEGSSSTGVSSTSESFTCLLPNTRYLIQIDGNDNVPFTVDQGDFIVTVSDDGSGNPGPSNDLICSAEALSTSMASAVNRTNKCSWEETGEPNTSNNMGGTGDDVTSNDYDETVWFTFVPTAEQSVRMQLDVTSGMLGGINYVLYEVPSTTTITCTGTPADIPTWSQLKEIASGSSTLLVGNEIDETWPCLKTSKRYYLQIDGNDLVGSVDVGNFNIQLTNSNQTTPLNDDICGIGATPGAFPSTSTSGNFGTFTTSTTKAFTAQNNTCATQQVGEPETDGPLDDITDGSYDHTLWYKFVASNTDGTYNINVTNGAGDAINAYIGVWREDNTAGAPVCPSTTWNNMTQIKESNNVDLNNNETLDLACWEIEEGKTYFVQIQGIDGVLDGDVGNNFSVSVQFTSGTTNPADNICTAPTALVNNVNIGADNRCATTQSNEPNVSPSPQTSADGSAYDETLWYKFVAPASGEVELALSSFSPVNLNIGVNLYVAPSGFDPCVSGFTGLIKEDESDDLLNTITSTSEFRCLIPGKTYYMQFDGSDLPLVADRGTWNFKLRDLIPSIITPENDEPCNAEDVTINVRPEFLGPCADNTMDQTGIYSISGSFDLATRTDGVVGCNGSLSCNDYWYKFTVPLSATGIRIQGNDEHGLTPLINSSTLNIGAYRGSCNGGLTPITCGTGGTGNDIDFTIATFPGETIYLQMFNSGNPASTSYPNYSFCLSVDCPAKLPCHPTVDLGYDQPQCWNMNTNGTDYSPIYYDCLSGDNNSVNYFTFRTDCDGTPVDTVQMIFSLTNLGCGQTAMSMVQDNTPCTPDYQEVVVNCAVFEEVLGGTTATNFNQTYILPGCTYYVVQIISDENTVRCSDPLVNRLGASAGQILFVKGTSPTTILPIELLSFTGYNDGEVNVLNWTTASEINSLKFEIEKSYDATNFEYIGEKLAAGNSNIPVDYTFNDENPQVGDNYYRLKMYDTDGTFKYSEIINIKLGENNTAINDGIVKIYPNPTNGLLNIQYQASRATELDLNVFDVTGRNMINDAKKVERGMNIIQIDAMQFAKGMYILNLLDKEQQQNHQAKFVKE